MSKRLTLNEFIKRSIEIYGTFFDYSKVIYIDMYTKVIIICPIHGEFLVTPVNHLKGRKCPKCKADKIGNLKRFTKKDFVQKAFNIHSDKYGYDNFIYKDSQTKGYVTCLVNKDHGDFSITPNNHIRGRGCPKCKFQNQIKRQQLTLEEFIRRARIIHGDKYDYSKVVYVNMYTKVIITCKEHGDFLQRPNEHLRGYGCGKCKASKGEQVIKLILDKHGIINETEYKIPELVSNYEYDFYLPDCNILIEFHGIQHYERIPYFHKTEDDFLKQKERDIFKKDHAHRFKYRLLEFNYKQLKHMTREQFEEMILSNIKKYKKIIIT